MDLPSPRLPAEYPLDFPGQSDTTGTAPARVRFQMQMLSWKDENMPSENPRVIERTEARQGVALGHMRYVLLFSTALVIAAFAIIYFMYF